MNVCRNFGIGTKKSQDPLWLILAILHLACGTGHQMLKTLIILVPVNSNVTTIQITSLSQTVLTSKQTQIIQILWVDAKILFIQASVLPRIPMYITSTLWRRYFEIHNWLFRVNSHLRNFVFLRDSRNRLLPLKSYTN